MARLCSLWISVAFTACAINVSHAAGAYAIGRNGPSSWGGGGRDAANYVDAGRDALLRCGQRGPGCAIVAYFSQKCFSLAIPPGTGAYYWAIRNTIGEARQTVMDHCLASGRFCEVKVAFCDLRGLAAPTPVLPQPASIPAPRLVETAGPQLEMLSATFDGLLLPLVVVACIVVLGMAVVFRKQSFRSESAYYVSGQSAEQYDGEAARFRAMSRKLDAETELADSLIKAKRTRAELDDIEELFRD